MSQDIEGFALVADASSDIGDPQVRGLPQLSNVPYILGHSEAELRRLMLQTLEDRLREAVVAVHGQGALPQQFCAWVRV